MTQLSHPDDAQRRGQALAQHGTLFIVSAPSGAGKSTLCRKLRDHFGDLAYSISFTTRAPRPGERNGREYHFIDETEFEQGIKDNRWAEWAFVHGNYYGSSADWIHHTLQSGTDILMDIDVQGARQITTRFRSSVTIFIMPPSLEELERRLRKRGADPGATIDLRLVNAKQEMKHKERYMHVVVNDDLATATSQLIAIVQRYRDARAGVA